MKKWFTLAAFFMASACWGQVVVVNDINACANGQAPTFNGSTYDCNTVGGGTTVITGSGLLSGGKVVWIGNLDFTISPANYLIAGNSYQSPQTDITLDAADGSNPRFDLFIVDNTGTVSKITGTPATPAAKPSTEPTTQLELNLAYIDTSATTPSNFSTVNVYLEDTEWTCTESANLNCASTSNPFAGTKDIEATSAVAGNNITLVKPAAATENISVYGILPLRIRSKAKWPNPKSLVITALNGSTQVGLPVTLKSGTFGFDSAVTGDYQLVVIPITAFGVGQNLITTFVFTVAGGGGSIGFYLDNILLQASADSQPPVFNANSPFATGWPQGWLVGSEFRYGASGTGVAMGTATGSCAGGTDLAITPTSAIPFAHGDTRASGLVGGNCGDWWTTVTLVPSTRDPYMSVLVGTLAGANARLEIGMFTSTCGAIGGDDTYTDTTGFGIKSLNGETWKGMVTDAGGTTFCDLGVGIDPSSYNFIEMQYLNSTQAKFYANGQLRCVVNKAIAYTNVGPALCNYLTADGARAFSHGSISYAYRLWPIP